MRTVVLALLAAALSWGVHPDLKNVKSVYLLPMMNGMDQYLANQIQRENLYVVTTDPAAADAILTDAIGPGFERKMSELYPHPPPPAAEEEDEEKEKATTESRDGAARPESTFRRGRGTVFLVERRTRNVVWSTYLKPKNSLPREMDKTAREVTARLKKDLAGGN